MVKIFGVIGYPIEHSLSPVMFNAAFEELKMDCKYYAFKVEPDKLAEALYGARALGFGGLNVTIPLKEKAAKIVELEETARLIGAVNTIDLKDFKGYNTDGIGALKALEKHGIEVEDKRILILGAGGAARAIAFQLAMKKAALVIANRTESRAIALADEVRKVGIALGTGLENLKSIISKMDILINTTSVGMFPNVNETLVTSELMHPQLAVFDIVYNPLETKLLKEAKKAGAKTIPGIDMLIFQGAEAFKIWLKKEAPLNAMERAVKQAIKTW
jgi:shikimate dehydrogenase